jgi:hypothetical protein
MANLTVNETKTEKGHKTKDTMSLLKQIQATRDAETNKQSKYQTHMEKKQLNEIFGPFTSGKNFKDLYTNQKKNTMIQRN